MYIEECQIQTLSAKNGKISVKTSPTDVKSKTEECKIINGAVKFNR